MKITRRQLRNIIREYIDQQGIVSDDHNPSSDRFSAERQQDDYEDTFSSYQHGNSYIAIYENEGIQAFIDELHANPPMGSEMDELIAQAETSGYEEIMFTLEDIGLM